MVQQNNITLWFRAQVGLASAGPIACFLGITVMVGGEGSSGASANVHLILAAILLLNFSSGFNAAGSYCVVLDLYPSGAALFSGVDNTIAQSTGIMAPLLTGVLLDRGGCPSAATFAAAGSASGSDGGHEWQPLSESCMAAWQSVFGVCTALFILGWGGFAMLTCADYRYKRTA
eukprot:SAG11_NODE_2309_length_3542_cov_2.410398_1_plen_174_part_00